MCLRYLTQWGNYTYNSANYKTRTGSQLRLGDIKREALDSSHTTTSSTRLHKLQSQQSNPLFILTMTN
jgi:hypothetical protein